MADFIMAQTPQEAASLKTDRSAFLAGGTEINRLGSFVDADSLVCIGRLNLDGVTLNGNIAGSGSSVISNGNTKLNGTLSNANFVLQSGELNFNSDTFTTSNLDAQDGIATDYYIQKLLSTSDVKYSMDLDLVNKSADRFVVGADSTGEIIIDSLNIANFKNLKDCLISVLSKLAKKDNLLSKTQ